MVGGSIPPGAGPASEGDSDPGREEPGAEDPSLVRRRDRAKDDGWIRSFLDQAPYGFLATVADGIPFVNSNLFVYDLHRHAIYLHTHRTGRTPTNVAQGGAATFTVASMGRLLPAPVALEFSVEYGGVVAFGEITPVEDDGEARAALQAILDRYAPHLRPGEDYRPITADEMKRTSVHRLDIGSWSGKEKVVAPDFPGAYWFEERDSQGGTSP